MRGAVAGFGLVVVLSVAWAVFVLARAWVDGDLARTFPGCDPCGFRGYAYRMVVVTGLFLGMFGIPAAVVGWSVERVLRRSSRGPTPQ
jgi:hypothetical protein